MLQWRRWCLHPDYCVGVEHEHIKSKFQNIEIPLVSIGFSDDELLSPRNLSDLHELFGIKNKQLKLIHPQDVGEKRIGHLNVFREKFKENLWSKLFLSELQI